MTARTARVPPLPGRSSHCRLFSPCRVRARGRPPARVDLAPGAAVTPGHTWPAGPSLGWLIRGRVPVHSPAPGIGGAGAHGGPPPGRPVRGSPPMRPVRGRRGSRAGGCRAGSPGRPPFGCKRASKFSDRGRRRGPPFRKADRRRPRPVTGGQMLACLRGTAPRPGVTLLGPLSGRDGQPREDTVPRPGCAHGRTSRSFESPPNGDRRPRLS